MQAQTVQVCTRETARFQVEVEGLPPVQVGWLLNEKPVTETVPEKYVTCTQHQNLYTLELSECKPSMSGTVKCVAENAQGRAISEAQLIIEETPKKVAAKPKEEAPEQPKQVKPKEEAPKPKPEAPKPKEEVKVRKHLQPVECYPEESVTLELELESPSKVEPSEVKWFHKGMQIAAKEGMQMEVLGKVLRLTLGGVSPESAGEYSVVIGDQKASLATVSVKDKPLQILRAPLAQTAKVSEKVEFICELSMENANVTWLKDGKQLAPSAKFEMVQEGRVHKLVIPSVTKDESAKYAVKVMHSSLIHD